MQPGGILTQLQVLFGDELAVAIEGEQPASLAVDDLVVAFVPPLNELDEAARRQRMNEAFASHFFR